MSASFNPAFSTQHEGTGHGRYDKNLLIVHTPRLQDVSDWQIVRQKINERAPDIDVRITRNLEPDPAVQVWQTSRPSLVFSVFCLIGYDPRGGTVYSGRSINKAVEIRRMIDTGLPVPRTALLTPDLVLKHSEWGEYVIVKPIVGKLGERIRLVRADELQVRRPQLTGEGKFLMLVQPYIDHVDEQNRLYYYRVLTLFGEPLYASERNCPNLRRPLSELAAEPDAEIAANAESNQSKGKLIAYPDVIALARKVATSFPRIPCLAQDIIRSSQTGELYILETNPMGYSWHLSSDYSRRPGYDKAFAQAKYNQFGALDIVADKLIEKTRLEAM